MNKSVSITSDEARRKSRTRPDQYPIQNDELSIKQCIYALSLIQWAGKGVRLMSQAQATELGALLRQRRQSLGLSTHRLSALVGVRQSTITRLERGEIAAPRPDKLARIAKALGISLADLYARAGYHVPDDLLPSFPIYLKAKYHQLPPKAITELTQRFDELMTQHGIPIEESTKGGTHDSKPTGT
jgi:transcriptional regulator with XRE-family HTH domain